MPGENGARPAGYRLPSPHADNAGAGTIESMLPEMSLARAGRKPCC